ncbi:MAG: MATE family efflux transporter, partial [Caldisericaceae bacterium]
MRKVSREEILNGNIVKVMFALGIPVMLSQLLFTVYNMADTFWLGHMPVSESGSAVAGLQVAFPIIWFLISFSIGFAMAGIALVSQYIGAKQYEKANYSASQVISLAVIFGVAIGVIGFFFMPLIARLITNVSNISSVAIQYMKVFFIGVPFIFIGASFQSILSAMGDNVTWFQISLITNILNIVLDPFLIFGWWGFPRMGVVGAALATVICEAIAAGIAIYFLLKGTKGVKIIFRELAPDLGWFAKIFKIGLPAAFGNSATSFGFVVLTGLIGRVANAEATLAAYGIGDRAVNIIFIVVEGIGASLVTMVGQNLGANRIDRAEEIAKTGIKVEFAITIAESLLLYLVRAQIFALFIPGRQDIIAEGVKFLNIFIFGLPFFGLLSAVEGVFRGSGHNTPPMIADLVRLWVLRIPLSYILMKYYGSNGIWWGMTLSNVFSSLLILVFYIRGSWKKVVIEKPLIVE